MHKHPLKSAGFKVLKAPDVPSVLIELGYVSSKDDLKQLTSRAWQGRTAGAIVQAVDTFFSTRLAGGAGRAPVRGDRWPKSLSLTIKTGDLMRYRDRRVGYGSAVTGRALRRTVRIVPPACTCVRWAAQRRDRSGMRR